MENRLRLGPCLVGSLALAFAVLASARTNAQESGQRDPERTPKAPSVWTPATVPAAASHVENEPAPVATPPVPVPRYDDGIADPALPPPPDTELDFALDPGGQPEVFAPNMLGDRRGVFFIGPPPPSDTTVLKTSEEQAVFKAITRFSAADNRSPRPQNRLWYSFNYFDNAFESPLDINRHTWGGEFAFFRQRMSIEVLAHVDFFDDRVLVDDVEFGDMSTVLKGVLYQDVGFLISWGLGTTWPTGDRPRNVPGESVILSPFFGYLFAFPNSRWFVQGFEEVDILFREDRLLLQSDIGLGYWLRPYNPANAFSGLAPTIEAHVYTPIPLADEERSAKGALASLNYFDVVNITVGATLLFYDRATFALAFGFPVSNRTDYDFELQAHVNWRFGAKRL
jgi:hypothetical protein